MRLLGLDPGLRHTGWGIVDAEGNRLHHVASGRIDSGEGTIAERLVRLYDGITDVIARFHPDEAAVEETYVNMNPSSTLKLGLARGTVILAPAKAGLEVAEYSPSLIKKSVVGSGRAEKEQIGRMVRMLLPGAEPSSADAADALAIAICHAHHAATRRSVLAGALA